MTYREGELDLVVQGIIQELLDSGEITSGQCKRIAGIVKKTLNLEDELLQELDAKARKLMEQYSDKMEGVNAYLMLQKIKSKLAQEMNIVL